MEAITYRQPVCRILRCILRQNHIYRTVIVHFQSGTVIDTVEVALYPKIEQDADGNPLTGEKSYLLHFESYPQVLEGGFWSVTAYGDDDFLIDNPIGSPK